jgi:quercetin dioxygenase-like cupin family protein
MKRKYRFTAKNANKFNKHGIDLVVYGENYPPANVVHVSVKEGHFQDFYDVKSSYVYYIIKGKGTFVLNDEKVEAEATDLIVIPPKTRIHYFGTMEMVLSVVPAFDEKNERHVRFVHKVESKYNKMGLTTKYVKDKPGLVYKPHSHGAVRLYSLGGSIKIRKDNGRWQNIKVGQEVRIKRGQLHEAVEGPEGWEY